MKKAMIVMGHTITGAASGETADKLQRRRVQNLRQKDRRITNLLFYLLFFDVCGDW
jgi:hypothetical protein